MTVFAPIAHAPSSLLAARNAHLEENDEGEMFVVAELPDWNEIDPEAFFASLKSKEL